MKKAKLFSIITVIFLHFFTSCSNFSKEKTITNNDTIPYKLLHFEMRDSLCKNSNCTSFTSEYISLENPKYQILNDSVNNYTKMLFFGKDSITKTYNKNPKAFAQKFFKEYYNLKKSIPKYDLTWFLNSKQNITFNKFGVFSFSFFTDDFLGGAHGSASETLFNFDVQNGKQITINDIIINDDNGALMLLGEKYFRQAQGLNDKINLEDAGYFTIAVDEKEEGIFKLTDNFSFTPQGLYFVYAQYQIGAYAIGMPSFTIPYSALKNIAKKNSVLDEIIKTQTDKN